MSWINCLLLDYRGGNLEHEALELQTSVSTRVRMLALKVMEIRALGSEQSGRLPAKEAKVALCFKVPLRFRQWFKLQAVRQGLSMTEFLVKATAWYVEAHSDSDAPDDNED